MGRVKEKIMDIVGIIGMTLIINAMYVAIKVVYYKLERKQKRL